MFGFELPAALAALAAAALPVLLHLMRRREVPVRKLPTIALLRRAEVQSKSKARLVDLLLLVCRVLLIALAALGAAQPYREETVAHGDGRAASVAIVIDDSMSMTRIDRGTTLVERAIERVSQIAGSLPEGSELAVIAGGAPARVIVGRSPEIDGALDRVRTLVTPSGRPTDLPSAVARAVRELAGARLASRRIVVLTDGAAHAAMEDVAWPEGGIDVDIELIGEAPSAPNVSITSAVAVEDPTTAGMASVRFEVRAFGGEAAPARTLHATLEQAGRVLDRIDVSLERGAANGVMHGPIAGRGDARNPAATVHVDAGDSLPMDDSRGVLLRAASARQVLLVDGDPHPSREQDEVGFVTRALELAPREEGTIAYRIVDADTFAATDFAGTDVIVLANVDAPSAAVSSRVVDFVARGGGLLVTGGDRVDPRRYEARLAELLPARIRAATSTPASVGWRTASKAPVPTTGLERVETARRLLLEPKPGAESWLTLEDRSTLLASGRFGDGRVALLATTIDDAWTDLPLRPGFLPLVLALMRQLAPWAALPDRAFAPGETVRFAIPPPARRAEITAPDGEVIECAPEDLASPCEIATRLPGAYATRVAERGATFVHAPRASFLVAAPERESDLARGPLPPRFEGDHERNVGARVRKPLAKYFFFAMALFALIEAVLRSQVAREGGARRLAPLGRA